MAKRYIGITLAIVILLSVFTGCASANKSSSSATEQAAPPTASVGKTSVSSDVSGENSSNYGSQNIVRTDGSLVDEATAVQAAAGASETPKKDYGVDSLAGTGSTLENVSNAILAERKIIRSANLTIEVENFDEAVANINSVILGIGIVQESNISTERIYIDNELKLLKHGTIVLRVYKEKFDSVISNLKGIGTVLNETINGQDVTDQYVDIESRIRILKLEQSKLEAYLAKLDDLDQIFKTESRLTEIRQEIESLTGNLNKMSSLVELSTITIMMNEKRPDSDAKAKPVTYGQKLLNNLKRSFEGVVTFMGEVLIVIVSAIPVLLLLGLLVLLVVSIVRRIARKPKNSFNNIVHIVNNVNTVNEDSA